MSQRVVIPNCSSASGRAVSRSVPRLDHLACTKRVAATLVLSAGLLGGQAVASTPALAVGEIQVESRQGAPSQRPLSMLMAPPVLASTLTSGGATAVAIVEEAEELVLDVFKFFQDGAVSMGNTVHHLQVVHALEQLEAMPLNQVVDLQLLKLAMHPTAAAFDEYDSDSAAGGGSGGAAAAALLDSALDSVAEWRLRDVVDVSKLASALQDVPPTDWTMDPGALQRDAPTIRRAVHWDTLAEAVRPAQLRRALAAMGGGGSAFAELDMRVAVSAVRMDAVRAVLDPPEPEAEERSHTLEASGMYMWEM